MSGWVVVLVVLAIGFVAIGLQVLSRDIQRSPVDVRRPDPLIDVTRSKSVSVRPAELHHLVDIVSNALLSDAYARAELQPVLDELAVGDGPPPTITPSRRRSKRTDQIEAVVAELERVWVVSHDRSSQTGTGRAT